MYTMYFECNIWNQRDSLIFGVLGWDDALNTNGFDTLKILGNIVAKLAKTSSEIPWK